MNKKEITQKIKDKAIELGFSKIGIARAEKLETEAVNLEIWLKRGFHADMKWMSESFEKRIDPMKILPDAKSVISIALNYFVGVPHAQKSEGKISIYALGKDYHIVMREKMEKLLNFIKELVSDVEAKIYVDSGPVLEKVWASRAGIGWIGKHSNLITREFGSWVFLGEIICNIELEYDEPIADFCGKCTHCIDACPTGAIVEPYIVNSNLCISYWTIEFKGDEFPSWIRRKFDNLIFGCDICQEVCPWNKKFQKVSAIEEFQPYDFNINPNLFELEKLDEETFRIRYKFSPIKRAKFKGFMRNVKNAIENFMLGVVSEFKFSGAIFDLDGVVADTMSLHRKSWQAICERFGRNLSDEEFKKVIFGRRGAESARILFGEKISDEEAKIIGIEVDEIFRVIARGNIKPVDGVIEFIRELKNAGVKIALATSAPEENVRLIFDELGLWGLFDVVVSAKDVVCGKPEPDIFLLAAERLRCQPRECIVFEDSLPGLVAGRRAGMMVVGIETTLSRAELSNYADACFKNFVEILEILKQKIEEMKE